MLIKIKPLSVNQCWQGRRFKTRNYNDYEQELLYLLSPLEIPEGYLKVEYIFGVSSSTDWDNSVKPFQDILQKKYGFNDNKILEAVVKKKIVKKGDEFIEFKIEKYIC